MVGWGVQHDGQPGVLPSALPSFGNMELCTGDTMMGRSEVLGVDGAAPGPEGGEGCSLSTQKGHRPGALSSTVSSHQRGGQKSSSRSAGLLPAGLRGWPFLTSPSSCGSRSPGLVAARLRPLPLSSRGLSLHAPFCLPLEDSCDCGRATGLAKVLSHLEVLNWIL